MSTNMRNPAIRRIMADVRELKFNPSSRYHAAPLEDNPFEWHFTIRGPEGTAFEGGIYHGRILLPAEYPMKPPNIVFLTKNGRFDVGVKICLSISAYHEETWQPAWGVRTMLEAIISFLPSEGAGAIGALDYTPVERKKLAVESLNYCCALCGKISELLPPLEKDEKIDSVISQQIAQLHMSKPTTVLTGSSPKPPATAANAVEPPGTPLSPARLFTGVAAAGNESVPSSPVPSLTPGSPMVPASPMAANNIAMGVSEAAEHKESEHVVSSPQPQRQVQSMNVADENALPPSLTPPSEMMPASPGVVGSSSAASTEVSVSVKVESNQGELPAAGQATPILQSPLRDLTSNIEEVVSAETPFQAANETPSPTPVAVAPEQELRHRPRPAAMNNHNGAHGVNHRAFEARAQAQQAQRQQDQRDAPRQVQGQGVVQERRVGIPSRILLGVIDTLIGITALALSLLVQMILSRE